MVCQRHVCMTSDDRWSCHQQLGDNTSSSANWAEPLGSGSYCLLTGQHISTTTLLSHHIHDSHYLPTPMAVYYILHWFLSPSVKTINNTLSSVHVFHIDIGPPQGHLPLQGHAHHINGPGLDLQAQTGLYIPNMGSDLSTSPSSLPLQPHHVDSL